MAIKSFGFASAGGGAGTDNLDDVTSRGATTTNAITVGGVTVGTEYSLPVVDGSENQVLQTNGTGTVSFATLDFTGGLEYKGAFNATAGTPSLANAEKGDFYIIDTAGTIYGQTWAVGDHLLINEDMGGSITNSKIDKIDNTQAVTSVNTQTGAVVVSGNDILADHTAVNYTASNNNVDGHFSGVDTKLGTLLADITSESLNDLSDVSFTAGAGIDNYVLTYDNATTSWGAEAAPTASAASETVAGVIEIATNAEAGAGTATDKALVPSNISSLDLSAMNNTTSAFIALSDIPTASHSTAGILETATNAEATNATANDKIITPANLSHIDLSTFDNDAGFISDITSESLNDLSDVSFTAGAGIDNYVLTYDNGTSSWGAEVVPSAPVTSVNTQTGAVVVSGNDILADHTAVNYTSANNNVDGHFSGVDSKLGTLLADITSESLNDLSDVSFTAGAGIDNYVLTYDNGTSSWGAEAAPTASAASETVAGVIEIATNAEATAGTATDKALVPSNISSLDLSAMDNTTSAFISDITGESLNDLSDVSFTAGAGIDNYVLTYDNGTSSWGAEAVPGGSPASETTAGIIEIATNAEATAGTATDKALVPSNLSSVDLSVLDNTTSAFITAGDIPTASETVAGVIEIATNAEAGAGTATDKALVPSNISSLDLSAMDNITSAFISDITSESLNDLSDVSFTAGAGIDNYVLTYDHATTSWGAEASAGGGGGYTYSAITADPANAQYNYHYSCTGTFTVTLPASASGDAGKEIRIKNMGTGTITVDGNASETIDGQTTIDLDTQYSSITLIATGNTPAAWEIV
jgi:6,7-dimethyl-8-ribityllumazine synthase